MNPASLPANWAPSMPVGPRMASRHADEAAGTVAGTCWVLQRRCSLTPQQFGACFAGLALVSLLVATLFWVMGAPFVALFTGIELLALGAAFAWHALHAADGDRLSMQGPQLCIEQRRGLRCNRVALDLAGLRVVVTPAGDLQLLSAGRCVQVGAELDSARRRQVAADLRRLALD